MRDADFTIRPKTPCGEASGRPWSVQLLLTVDRDGVALAGNNVQVARSAAAGLDEDVLLWMASGWWVTARNQFAAAPGVAEAIVASASDELSRLTEWLACNSARDGRELMERLANTRIEARGPNYWR